MKQEHNKMKVAINSELSQRQKWQEINVNHNQQKEQRFLMDKIMMRARVSNVQLLSCKFFTSTLRSFG